MWMVEKVSPVENALFCVTNGGAGFSLLGASARPAENPGPGVLLFGSGQPGSDRVFNNVSFYALELRSATDDVMWGVISMCTWFGITTQVCRP